VKGGNYYNFNIDRAGVGGEVWEERGQAEGDVFIFTYWLDVERNFWFK
jgi:hypothetical protein